jgi:hypothetical protein
LDLSSKVKQLLLLTIPASIDCSANHARNFGRLRTDRVQIVAAYNFDETRYLLFELGVRLSILTNRRAQALRELLQRTT